MLKTIIRAFYFTLIIVTIGGCSSPYPLHYSFRWPILSLWPSTENHAKMVQPLTVKFDDRDLESNVKLMFIGDLMVNNGDRIPAYSERVKEILRSASKIIANCESPVSNKVSRGHKDMYLFKFLMPMDYLTGITTDQVDTDWELSIANNHIGDQKYDGFDTTVQSITEKERVRPFGMVTPEGPLHEISIEDMTIGLIAWTRWMNVESSFTNEKRGVYRQKDILGKNWEKEKQKFDIIVAYPHWDWEFQHFPHEDTVKQATSLFENGVDLIVGAHSHTLQAMEWYPGTDKVCFYGLGNFIGLTRSKATKMSAILEIRLSKEKENTTAFITGYTLYPTIQVDNKGENSRIVLMSEYEGENKSFYKERLELMYSGGHDIGL